MPVGDKTIVAGEIVSADTSDASSSFQVVKSKKSYEDTILGVVSTNPGVVLGDSVRQGDFAKKKVEGKVPVALAGRVPVKLSFENGDIKKGDYITSSDIVAGFGVKATKPGRVVGIALENAHNGVDTTVLVLINPHYAGRDLDSNGAIANFTGSTLITQEGSLDVSVLVSAIYTYFKDNLHIVFEDGVIKLTKLVANVLESASVQAQNVRSDRGITTQDTSTGEVYCIQITNGQISTAKGGCYGDPTTSTQIIQEEHTSSSSAPTLPFVTPTPSQTPTEEIVTATPSSSPINTSSESASFTPSPKPSIESKPSATPKVMPSISPSPSVSASASHVFSPSPSSKPKPSPTPVAATPTPSPIQQASTSDSFESAQ
jgi:hypothetical protein